MELHKYFTGHHCSIAFQLESFENVKGYSVLHIDLLFQCDVKM